MLAVAKQGVVLVLGLGLAAPGMAPPPAPPQDRAAIDGEATAAACRPLGFDLDRRDRYDSANAITVSGRRVTAPPPGPPPPPPPPPPRPTTPPPLTLPIEPTRKEDRVEYGGPPVVASPSAQADLAAAPVLGRYRVPGERPIPDTERYPDATPNPVKRVADEPVSTFSIDVDTASYANVRRFVDEGAAPPRDAVRVEEMINAFDYGYDRPANAAEPFAVTTAVVASPWSAPAAGREIVHIGLQGYELPPGERRPLNRPSWSMCPGR